MKKLSHPLFVMTIRVIMTMMLLLSLTNCSTIQETLASKNDASQAYNLDEAQVRTYKFTDIISLKIILTEKIEKYRSGNNYLKKMVNGIVGKDRVPHERRVIKNERIMNIINAEIENLVLLYPDEWDKEKESLNSLFDELYKNYRESYIKLNPVL